MTFENIIVSLKLLCFMEKFYTLDGKHYTVHANSYVLLKDTTVESYPKCYYCNKGSEASHYVCIAKDIFSLPGSWILLIIIIAILVAYIRDKFKKH